MKKTFLLAAACSIVALAALGLSASSDSDFARQLDEIRQAVRTRDAGGLPPGTIVLSLNAECPSGFSKVQALDGLFPKGASAAETVGTKGGAEGHTHRLTVDIAHEHTIRGTTDQPRFSGFRKEGKEIGSVADSYHQHDFRVDTERMYNARKTAVTEEGSNQPPYRTVNFCQKD